MGILAKTPIDVQAGKGRAVARTLCLEQGLRGLKGTQYYVGITLGIRLLDYRSSSISRSSVWTKMLGKHSLGQ